MTEGESKSSGRPVVTVPIVFYRGVQEIAEFMGLHERTVRKLIHTGKIPVKKDGSGRWVLTNLDYYRNLEG